MRALNELLWKYFEPSENRIAECKQCKGNLSYKTTTHNLVMHLNYKHKDCYNEFTELNLQATNKTKRLGLPKVSNLLIWNYFKQNPDKVADCRLCDKKLSYRTTVHNLKQHLKFKHPDSYKEFAEHADSVVDDSPEDHSSYESDDGEELHKVTDVWRYFDTDSGKNAQCVVCKSIVLKDYEELKTHLRDNHPNLLLEILQDQASDHTDTGSNDGNEDNDNTYTEIVYLEQEPTSETVRKHKEKNPLPKPLKKRERQHSVRSSDDIPLKKYKKEEEENDELNTFIRYITCLLKKLPAEVFSNVQMEIINTILKANNEAKAANTSQSIVFNKELLNTSTNIITVDGITPVSNAVLGHHNYTISVASPIHENKTEMNS